MYVSRSVIVGSFIFRFFFHMAVLVSVFLRDNCSKSFAYRVVFFHMLVLFQLFHKIVLFSIVDFLNGHSI